MKDGGLIPGEPEDQDPYRRELGKQLGLVAFTSGIQVPFTSPNPILTIACDGLSALNEVSKRLSYLKSKQNHIGMVSIIT